MVQDRQSLGQPFFGFLSLRLTKELLTQGSHFSWSIDLAKQACAIVMDLESEIVCPVVVLAVRWLHTLREDKRASVNGQYNSTGMGQIDVSLLWVPVLYYMAPIVETVDWAHTCGTGRNG